MKHGRNKRELVGVMALIGFQSVVRVRKPCVVGGTALIEYSWDDSRSVYRRERLEVINGASGGSLVEFAGSPDEMQLEQMETVLEDAVACDEGGVLIFELGAKGLAFWRSVQPKRRQRLV